MMVFKGIGPGQDRKALPSLDSSTKRLADGLLQLAFSLNQQVGFSQVRLSKEPVLAELGKDGVRWRCGLLQGDQLVDLLLNTMTVPGSQPLPHGEYFYSLFKSIINTELLKNLETTVPLIMKASSGKSTMVPLFSCVLPLELVSRLGGVGDAELVLGRLLRSVCC